jgi:tetratricopeptide (TPR) repeat protein
MAARKFLPWLSAAAMFFSASQALAVTDADRIAVYRDFLTQYQAKKYADAQPLAEKLVALTEEQYGAEDLQLTNPLTNLATVHFRQGHFPQAIETYQRTLRILQAKSTIADKQQITPLHGLGVALLANKDPESAVVALKRAADLSRNTDGLFNINQVEFIDPLVDAYASTGRYAEAEKEAQYALRIEEAAYGRNSVKLVDRLDKLANWYEFNRRYTSQRNVYDRSLGILARSAPETDMRRVEPLRGIARAYRLEAFYGTEGADSGATFNNGGSTGAPVFPDGSQQRRGEASLLAALAVVDANSPVDLKVRGEVLADLGDWYLVSNALRRAYDSYAEAWKAFAQVDNTRALAQPRVLAFRQSISSVDRSQLDPAEAVTKVVELHFMVDRDGRVDRVTSPTTDVPDTILRSVMTSIKRSRFAPRIENGLAVPTEDMVFYEKVLVRVAQPDGQQPSGKAEESSPEKKTEPESAPSPPEPEKPEPEKPVPEKK